MNGKLVVFDLDGTLNQTNLYSVQAFQKALKEYGITDKTDEYIASMFGARPEDYIKEYFPDANSQLQTEFLHKVAVYESELIEVFGKSFDGVLELLKKLKADEYLTAVCSNSSERYISMVLRVLGLTKWIDHIQPLIPGMIKDDTLKILLGKLSPEKAVMVGDRIFDKNAARSNQIPFIGCAYGYNPEEMEGSDFLAQTALEIFDGVKKLIG